VVTRRIRLGSLNLLSGRSLQDGRADPALLAAALAMLDVDVLALQEVDRFQPRSGGVDQAALAAQVLGASCHRFVATVAGTPGEAGWRAGRLDGGAAEPGPSYGIAVISRLPVQQWRVLPLGRARGRFPLLLPTRPPKVRWMPDEPRAIVAAVLADPAITVTAGHLSFVPGVNVRQLRQVRRWAGGLPAPRLLLGDLNLPGGLPARITGWTPLVDSPTFPAPAPRLQLDHVLAEGLPRGTRAHARVLELPVSDHRAVLVDLDLPDG
jgi:endonuclease/exonuclease/phosphatase family metal-dependent hydrolase